MIKGIRKTLSLATFHVRNWFGGMYEAARRWSPQRAFIPSPEPRDACFDISAPDRLEIVRKSRWFEANDAFANRLGDLYEQFVVGAAGLLMVPASSSPDWNQKASRWLDKWSRIPDLSSRLPLSSIQSLCARREFFDGQILVVKAYGLERNYNGRQVAFPRIQLVETHRIGTPDAEAAEGRTIVDGWEIDFRGRPVAVWYRERTADGEKWTRKDAERVILIGEPGRPGQYNCLPFLYPVMDDLQDLRELQNLTMQKAKDNASVTRVIKNASGEVTASQRRKSRFGQDTETDSAGNEAVIQRVREFQTILGPRTVAIKKGEEFDEKTNSTPTVADQAMWSTLKERVAIGSGFPSIFVAPELAKQGTAVRGEYDLGDAFFRARFYTHANAWREIYEWVIGWGIENDPELAGAPEDWREVDICPPRSVNVDVGYNSEATLREIEAGARTFSDHWGRFGGDWRKKLRQKAIEADYAHQLLEEFPRIELHEISTLLEELPKAPSEAPGAQPKQPAKKSADDEEGD